MPDLLWSLLGMAQVGRNLAVGKKGALAQDSGSRFRRHAGRKCGALHAGSVAAAHLPELFSRVQ